MIKNYFKIAWRNLLKHSKISIINIFGLGVGMAATILIMLWVQNETSFDKDQPDSERVYRLTTAWQTPASGTIVSERSAYLIGEFAKAEIPEIENATRIKPFWNIDLHYNGEIISEKKVAYVDEQWFNIFHYTFVDGVAASFSKNPYSLILSETAAKRYFGKQEAVGKILRIDTVNYLVQGVVKDAPANSSFQYNLLIPIAGTITSKHAKRNIDSWSNDYVTFLKLRSTAAVAKVSNLLTDTLNNFAKQTKSKASYSLVNIKDMHFEKDIVNAPFVQGNRTIVNIFIALAVLLLSTACINYVNLTTARSSIRSKEVSIRKIVGAGRFHLFAQFMSESFLVSFFSVVLALMLVKLTLPFYINFTGKDFTNVFSSYLLWSIVGITLLVSFVLNGLYPALLLSSFNPLNIFRGKTLLNFRDSGLRKGLVVVQFTISIVLLIGTLVIYRQLKYMENIDLGYDKSHVFTINMPSKIYSAPNLAVLQKTIKQEMKAQGAIAEVAYSAGILVDFGNSSGAGSFDWNGKPKDLEVSIIHLGVDQDFKKLMKLKVSQGRWFTGEKADSHNVLINETAAKTLNIRTPLIGQRFVHRGDTGAIIGVVKDFHYESLHEKIGPLVIESSDDPDNAGVMYIKTVAGNTPAAVAAAQKIMKKFAPDDPFDYNFLDDYYDNLYRTEQQSSLLISLFAGIAIIVSAMGLLGLVAFAAEQKVKEIGIRKILGASVQHIVALLSSDLIRMVFIAILIGFPIAWVAMNKWLQDFAYRIHLSWWLFGGAAGILLLIAIVTVSIQAIKAANANPVKSLRSE